ncbi:MAG: hypothetical protein E1N59_2594 [Puniceicoccaceae bacterium 5H]|nr:MAG: hypothetical protein E1N59_2594 [Puniceicoccaceae bacterium 5H]
MQVRPLLSEEVDPAPVMVAPLREEAAPEPAAPQPAAAVAASEPATQPTNEEEPPLSYYDGGGDAGENGPFIDLKYARDEVEDDTVQLQPQGTPLTSLEDATERIDPAVKLALKEYLKGEFREVKKYRPTLSAERVSKESGEPELAEELEDPSTED